MNDNICSPSESEVEFTGSLLTRPNWEDGAWVWRFRRNCSISPSQLFNVFASFALVSALLALFFWCEGVPLVIPFFALDIAAMAWAFLVYARHAADEERIAISADAVVIEWIYGGQQKRVTLHPRRAHILAEGSGLVRVFDKDVEIHIGRYLRPHRRQQFSQDLRRAILVT